ncbi:membrane protein [soil metagenome]
MLVAVYAIFALAASARSIFQIVTDFEEAPLAYVLSAIAGVVYIVATIALAKGLVRLAWITIGFELTGVIVVGFLSLLDSDLFPDQTVWTAFGQGYGYIPLVLPIIGLWWLRRVTSAEDST